MNLAVGTGAVALAGLGCAATSGLGCAIVVGGAALAEGNNLYDGAVTVISGEVSNGNIVRSIQVLSPALGFVLLERG